MRTSLSVSLILTALIGRTVVADDHGVFEQATQAARQSNLEMLPIADGKFKPTWDSLAQYQVPDWFRDAKFGIWAHWGPQCEPEQGDWYATNMYQSVNKQGKPGYQYLYQINHYGHPSKVGFKDIINQWKAEKWNPDALMALYKRAGAKYFMGMANHHDNLDLWDSKYQPWNSVLVGPKKDLIAGWEKAARAQGLRFGVSIHAARTWSWFETAQGADKTGPLKDVPYDGKLTAADGHGQWWNGLDPQDLYAQNHAVGAPPDQAYCFKYFNRVEDLIRTYKPDLVYFDDGVLPLNKVSPDYGLKIVADFYNRNAEWNGGKNEAVVNLKALKGDQTKCMVLDIERGKAEGILPDPWQTDTCIGHWHYDRPLFEKHGYKEAPDVIRMLIDIVSKNGNLMLNIPVRGDGTIDDDEKAVLAEIGDWMAVNQESIYATRPWTHSEEGPTRDPSTMKNKFGGVVDVTPFTAQDIRYTQSKDGKTLYATVMGWPDSGSVALKLLADGAKDAGDVDNVHLLGSDRPVTVKRDGAALTLSFDARKPKGALAAATVFKIHLK